MVCCGAASENRLLNPFLSPTEDSQSEWSGGENCYVGIWPGNLVRCLLFPIPLLESRFIAAGHSEWTGPVEGGFSCSFLLGCSLRPTQNMGWVTSRCDQTGLPDGGDGECSRMMCKLACKCICFYVDIKYLNVLSIKMKGEKIICQGKIGFLIVAVVVNMCCYCHCCLWCYYTLP